MLLFVIIFAVYSIFLKSPFLVDFAFLIDKKQDEKIFEKHPDAMEYDDHDYERIEGLDDLPHSVVLYSSYISVFVITCMSDTLSYLKIKYLIS